MAADRPHQYTQSKHKKMESEVTPTERTFTARTLEYNDGNNGVLVHSSMPRRSAAKGSESGTAQHSAAQRSAAQRSAAHLGAWHWLLLLLLALYIDR